jgi:hypothetical protein
LRSRPVPSHDQLCLRLFFHPTYSKVFLHRIMRLLQLPINGWVDSSLGRTLTAPVIQMLVLLATQARLGRRQQEVLTCALRPQAWVRHLAQNVCASRQTVMSVSARRRRTGSLWFGERTIRHWVCR